MSRLSPVFPVSGFPRFSSIVDLGDAPQLQLLREHHDQKRQLLPMHELRQHQRLQLEGYKCPGHC